MQNIAASLGMARTAGAAAVGSGDGCSGEALETAGIGNENDSDNKMVQFLVGGWRGARSCVREQIEHHVAGSNVELAANLMLWEGDVAAMLRTAISDDGAHLTPAMLALAPMAGHDVWVQV